MLSFVDDKTLEKLLKPLVVKRLLELSSPLKESVKPRMIRSQPKPEYDSTPFARFSTDFTTTLLWA